MRIISQVINDAIFDAAAALMNIDMNAGNIPAELSHLRSLQMLGLSTNNLSGNQCCYHSASDDDDLNAGNILAKLSELRSLQYLGLSNNDLSGNQ